MPGGRPSKYKKEFCEQVVEFCRDGSTFEEFASEIGVCVETINEWARKKPEFSAAKKRAKANSLRWWCKIGKAGALGKIKNFQNSVWIFTMKCRFREFYNEEIATDELPSLPKKYDARK